MKDFKEEKVYKYRYTPYIIKVNGVESGHLTLISNNKPECGPIKGELSKIRRKSFKLIKGGKK